MEFWIKLLDTLQTYPVAEFRFGMVSDIRFHLSPAAFVVSDLLAASTDREKVTQNLDFFEGLFTVSDCCLSSLFDSLSLQGK